ncbi:hypothetical protein [Streptomyces geranii]|uniref:hypothetical protein n=1 Tax=Streptomyces geranii TaxID=2058923 RepID=UPI001E43ACE3|nr:hypothetical protein [Streptomyces geranii]
MSHPIRNRSSASRPDNDQSAIRYENAVANSASTTASSTRTPRSQERSLPGLKIIQEQVGHSHAGTTAIYMGVSNEYRNKLLEASMKNRLGDDWDATA